MKRIFQISAGLLVIFLLMGCSCPIEKYTIEDQLKIFINDTTPDQSLVIDYSDIHALWGGLQVVVKGDGGLYQKVDNGEIKQVKNLSKDELNEIVSLIIDLRLWQQDTPNREPMPDESKAYLKLTIGTDQKEIWEWFNDMEKNNRLVQILNLIKEIALI